MIGVLNRYRVFFIIGAILILAAAIYLIVQRQDMFKIPTRGVFVFNNLDFVLEVII